MSEVVPELEPQLEVLKTKEDVKEYFARIPQVDWPECEFEDCNNPVSYRKRDKFGEAHRSCTDHTWELDTWVRIHNGWEASAGADSSEDRGGEGNKEGGTG